MARQGFLARLFSRWRRRPPVPPPVPLHGPREFAPDQESEPLSVVARGNVFEFHLDAHFLWRSQDLSWEALRDRALDLDGNARGELLRKCWGPARTFDPLDAMAFENHMNGVLAGGWCYGEVGAQATCLPSVRVRVDPVLREHLRPLAVQQAENREAHEVAKLRAQHAEELTEIWLQVIRQLEQLPELGIPERQLLVPFAAALADGDFAKVMKDVRGERHIGTVALAEVLQLATHNFESVGLYEFAKAYDATHQAFRVQMGLGPYDPFTATSVEPPA